MGDRIRGPEGTSGVPSSFDRGTTCRAESPTPGPACVFKNEELKKKRREYFETGYSWVQKAVLVATLNPKVKAALSAMKALAWIFKKSRESKLKDLEKKLAILESDTAGQTTGNSKFGGFGGGRFAGQFSALDLK